MQSVSIPTFIIPKLFTPCNKIQSCFFELNGLLLYAFLLCFFFLPFNYLATPSLVIHSNLGVFDSMNIYFMKIQNNYSSGFINTMIPSLIKNV